MSNDSNYQLQLGRKLIRYGILLFLMGLITGFIIPAMENPRMGLSSHLEGTLNGMFLIILGIIWPKLHLSVSTLKWCFGLALFGTFTNWFTTLLAGIWGAGAAMMPLAGGGHHGSALQEGLIKAGLISVSVTMVIVAGIVFWGMRNKVPENEDIPLA